jgi:hypothetical protein
VPNDHGAMRKIGGRNNKKPAEAAESPTGPGSYATGTNMFRKLRVKPFSALGSITEHPSREDAAASRAGTPRNGNEDSGSPRDDAGDDKSSDPTAPNIPMSSTRKKRGLGLFRNKVLRGSGKTRRKHPHVCSAKSPEAVKPTPEAATEEAPVKEELELADPIVKERAARLYDVLNQSQNAAPQILEAARQRKPFDCASRLEPIPEKAATPTAVSTFTPFTWDAPFGCTAPEEGDMPLSPPLSPDSSSAMLSPPSSPTHSSDSVSPIDPTKSTETNSTYGSAPLYSEGVGAKEDNGIASPIFTALHNLDDALKADPSASCPPPTSVAASKSVEEIQPSIGTADNPRIESYRLGYLLAQVGLPDEDSGGGGGGKPCPKSSDEPPASPATVAVDHPTHAGPSLGEVIQSIKKSAASEEIANVNLARVAADLAAASEPNVDRDALKRGYLRRVSEIVKVEEKMGGTKGASTTRPSSEVVQHAKNVLRDIVCALNDAPAEPRSGDYTGIRLDNWSWLQSKSAESGTERRDLPRDSSFNRASSSTSRRDGAKGNHAIVNLLSFFKSKEEAEEVEDSESEESRSTSESSRSRSSSGSSSGASSSHSSGVDISVPSRKRFVFSSTSIDTSRVEEVESEISERSDTSSDSDNVNFSDPDNVNFSYSDQSEMSLDQQSSHQSRDGRPLTPLGLVSFIRAISKVKSSESLPTDDQRDPSSIDSGAGANVTTTKMNVDHPTGKRNHLKSKGDSRKHELRGDGSKRKFSPRTLFKQTNSSSKPPLHPVKTIVGESPTSGSIESNVSTKHVELDLANIIVTSAFGGDGSESIELFTSPDHLYKGNASQLVEVEMVSNEQGDQVACEVKPRSDGVWNADESRDDFESMEQARSMSFSTKQSPFRETETRDPPAEKVAYRVPSNEFYKESRNSNVPIPIVAGSYDIPIVVDGRDPGIEERRGASALETGTVGSTEGVDLLVFLVGSESSALWARDGTKKSTDLESEECSRSDIDYDDHSLAQSEPNMATVPSNNSVHQSKVRNHGRGRTHKRSFSGPPSLLLNSA